MLRFKFVSEDPPKAAQAPPTPATPPAPQASPVPLKRSRDYLISRGALTIAIIALLLGIPSIFVACFAYTRNPDLTVINNEIMIIQSQISAIMASGSNITESVLFQNVCIVNDYLGNGRSQQVDYRLISQNNLVGGYTSLIIEIDEFPAPVQCCQYITEIELKCIAPTDFLWPRAIAVPLPIYRLFSQSMLNNFTFTNTVSVPYQDNGIRNPNYFIQSPVAFPPGVPGSTLSLPSQIGINWRWDPFIPWTNGVDAFNFNGKMRFGIVETPNILNKKKK